MAGVPLKGMKTHINIFPTVLALLPLALVLPAQAQMGNDASAPATSTNAPAATSDLPSGNQDLVKHSDRSFVVKIAEGSTNEVALSRLADTHASSDDVKAFAQMMVNDHTKLNTQLSTLAASKGIDIQEAVEKGQKKGYESLDKKSAADFDKAYIKDMVKGHKETADLLKTEAADSKDSDLAQFATQTLPTVLDHLQKAEAIERAQ
jgi:putative membrane protein